MIIAFVRNFCKDFNSFGFFRFRTVNSKSDSVKTSFILIVKSFKYLVSFGLEDDSTHGVIGLMIIVRCYQ